MPETKREGLFYKSDSSGGLQFTCTRCSACCRFDSGYVWITQSDLSRMAEGLQLSEMEIVEKFCAVVDIGGFKQVSLSEQSNMDCVFWTNGACSIYEHRPLQCRSFPFWAPFLASRRDWDALESMCPGVNVGEHHSVAEIDEWMAARQWEPPLDADILREVSDDEG